MKGKELLESIDFLQNLEINDDDEIEIKLDVSAKGINVDFYVNDIFLRTLITLKLNQKSDWQIALTVLLYKCQEEAVI